MISYYNDDVKLPSIKKRSTSSWIKSVAAKYQKTVDSISYIFCSDEKILEVNKQYLQHDYYTDIITFDYTENSDIISGDIFVSIDRVKDNAKEFKVTFEEELRRVLIHGILHLLGYPDKKPSEERKMRQKENEALLVYEEIDNAN